MSRNYSVAARVQSGQLSSASYAARRAADEQAVQALFGGKGLPEIDENDLSSMRRELTEMVASGALR